ncbi:MAG: hypothetical protein QW165_01785 [Candidatus Woesearchaeota archaeon]
MVTFSIVRFYSSYTEIADFILIWALLTILVKWIFVRIKYATKTKRGLFKGLLTGALSEEDKRTLFSLEGLLSVILALMMTLGGMTYYKWSLKALFTGTTFPIVLALIVGALSFNAAGTRTKNTLAKLATAVLMGSLTFGLSAHSSRTGALWSDGLLLLFLFSLVIFNLGSQYRESRAGRRAPAGGEAGSAASKDVKDIKEKLEKSEAEVAKLRKTAEEAEKKHAGVLQDLKNTLASVTQLSNQLKMSSNVQLVLSSALAIGAQLFSQGASAADVQKELKNRNYDSRTINAVIDTLSPQVPAQQLQPAAEPRAAQAAPAAPPKVVPPPSEEIKLPSPVAEKVRKAVIVDAANLNEIQDKIVEHIAKYEEIALAIENLPNEMKGISELGMRVHGDLEQFSKAAAVLAEQTKGLAGISEKTEQLYHDASHALNTADLHNRQFKTATDPLFTILSSDSGQLARVAQELKEKAKALSEQLEIVEKNARRLKAKEISIADVNLFNAAYEKVERLLADIAQILEHHGDPVKNVLVALPGIAETVKNAKVAFEQLDQQTAGFQIRYVELFEQVQKLHQAKVEEERREGLKRIDVNAIKDSTRTLGSIVTGLLVTPVSGKLQGKGTSAFIPITKSDVLEMKNQANNALKILRDLDAERQKIIDMATGNPELNRLAQLLADLKGLPLQNDLLAFVNNKKLEGMADNPRGDSRLGRAMAQLILQMSSRTDDKTLTDLLSSISSAADALPKGAVQ